VLEAGIKNKRGWERRQKEQESEGKRRKSLESVYFTIMSGIL
jgi:hypothetical protein